MAIDHNDIYNIVERLRVLEEGLDKDQRSVNQLSATFKPKTVAVLTAKKDPKNPMAGKLVGSNESEELEEDPLEEGVATEDVLDKVRASFADYLQNVADEIKKDPDLKDKKREDSDLKKKEKRDRDLVAKEAIPDSLEEDPTEEEPAVGNTAIQTVNTPTVNPTYSVSSPVKTITNECGLWEVHGDLGRGFEIRHGNRSMRSRFKSLDEAVMALEMFAARRAQQNESADYIEEA